MPSFPFTPGPCGKSPPGGEFPFVDLYNWKPSLRLRDLTDNGIHLTPDGYRCMAAEVARQLGWPSHLTKVGKDIAGALRQEIIRKNQLFSIAGGRKTKTYLFGFRKHEQGQNAREIPEFDPLVQAEDAGIAHLQDLLHEGDKSAPRPPHAPSAPSQSLVSLPCPTLPSRPVSRSICGLKILCWPNRSR